MTKTLPGKAGGPHSTKDPWASPRLVPGTFTVHSFPSLAEGVEVLALGQVRQGERIWVGGTKHGLEVTHHLRFFHLDAPSLRPQLFAALRAIDGSRAVLSIVSALQIDADAFSGLLRLLEEERLIHFHAAPQSSSLATRREIEQFHLPHGSSFAHRREESIVITAIDSISSSPAGTIASSLASLLLGSGFERIKFLEGSPRSKRSQITDLDLGLSIFNGGDVGAFRMERLREIAHRSAILPLAEDRNVTTSEFNSSLVISIGYPRPDHHQRWISEDRTFLIVPGLSQREIRIGPIVVPGRTPCLRCFELNRIEMDFWREQVRQIRLLGPAQEAPKVASILIASLASSYATLWLDGDAEGMVDHPLYGQQYTLDLDTMQSRLERWQNHPECGCLWPAPHSSNPRMKSRA